MEHYVTLFNKLFLPQGLALHSSLRRHGGEFTLWVLCLDQETKQVLDAQKEKTLKTIPVEEIETAELLSVKAKRTLVEYCWTLTPFAPKAVFDRAPEAKRVTYLDSDVFFLKPPIPIFEELENSTKSVLITDHAYDAEYDQSLLSGQYCVQFLTFVRDSGEHVRKWWEDRCVEWCFARPENGKFGDQKYLDDWPVRFKSDVHVLQKQHLVLAPWNARRFPYSGAVAWHFHGLRLLPRHRVLLHAHYAVPSVVDELVYAPYVKELGRCLDIIGTDVVQWTAKKLLKQRIIGFVSQLRTATKAKFLGDRLAVKKIEE